MTSPNDQFLVFLDDGETFTHVGIGADSAVLRGDWDEMPEEMGVWNVSYEDDNEHKVFQDHIKEYLLLNRDNLLNIREKMPEL